MAEGIVTFFQFNELGFYQRNSDYREDISIDDILDRVVTWHKGRDRISETAPIKNGNRRTTYLKAIDKNEETGDYLITLWRSLIAHDGKVYGLRKGQAIDDDAIVNSDESGGDDVIWGLPAYYWFIPSLNIFASIKFPETVTDLDIMTHYIKDFVYYRSNINNPITETRTDQNGNEYEAVYWKGPHGNLSFRCDAKRFKKITHQADLELVASDITHFVKKETIQEEDEENKNWTRYFEGLPYVPKNQKKPDRTILVTVDARPTGKELKKMIEAYAIKYQSSDKDLKKSNLGFKTEGNNSQTIWLDEFIIKTTIDMPGDATSHYRHETFFKTIKSQREFLLAAFQSADVSKTA